MEQYHNGVRMMMTESDAGNQDGRHAQSRGIRTSRTRPLDTSLPSDTLPIQQAY